jgi:hypothetical protein
MDLESTVELMRSDDFKDRFKAEYYQALYRKNKLKHMLMDWEDDKLNFQPNCSYDIFMHQYDILTSYVDVLKRRAKIEGIELKG